MAPESASPFRDRSMRATLERAKSMVPGSMTGMAFNNHNGFGWYLLRAEEKDDPVIDEVVAACEAVGLCVALVSSKGELLYVSDPCRRCWNKAPCDREK